MMLQKICPICNIEFNTNRSRKIYCSKQCRLKASVRREIEREKDPDYKSRKRQKHNERRKERYHSDPDYRSKVLEINANTSQKTDRAGRIRERRRTDPEYAEKMREYGRQKYHESKVNY